MWREATMSEKHTISRREMLAMSAAASGIAMSGVGAASAQTGKRIEQLAPELDKIISVNEPIKDLADGFGGPLGPAEGPLWWKESGYLLFSDIHNNKRMKFTPGKGVSVDFEPTNRANGLTRDRQGRLLACEHDTRRVTRRELDGSLTVLANSFQGRRLNRPNDVVVKSDGAIFQDFHNPSRVLAVVITVGEFFCKVSSLTEPCHCALVLIGFFSTLSPGLISIVGFAGSSITSIFLTVMMVGKTFPPLSL